jgi:hypothetical protein
MAMSKVEKEAEEICDWVGEEDDYQGWLDALGHEDYINVEYLMAQFGVDGQLAQKMLNILQDFLE